MADGKEKRFLLPLSEYNRIYQVIHGVNDVSNAERPVPSS
jgi:hypothetical protein